MSLSISAKNKQTNKQKSMQQRHAEMQITSAFVQLQVCWKPTRRGIFWPVNATSLGTLFACCGCSQGSSFTHVWSLDIRIGFPRTPFAQDYLTLIGRNLPPSAPLLPFLYIPSTVFAKGALVIFVYPPLPISHSSFPPPVLFLPSLLPYFLCCVLMSCCTFFFWGRKRDYAKP